MSTAYNVIVFSFALVGLILGIVAVIKIGKDKTDISTLQTDISNLQKLLKSYLTGDKIGDTCAVMPQQPHRNMKKHARDYLITTTGENLPWKDIEKGDGVGWYKIEATNFSNIPTGKPTQSNPNTGVGYVYNDNSGLTPGSKTDQQCDPGMYFAAASWHGAAPKCSFLKCPEGTTPVRVDGDMGNPQYLSNQTGSDNNDQWYPRPDSLPECLCRPLDL